MYLLIILDLLPSYIEIVQNSLAQKNTFNFTATWNCSRVNFDNQFNVSISSSSSTDVYVVNDCLTSFILQNNTEYTINVSICVNGLYNSVFYFGKYHPYDNLKIR